MKYFLFMIVACASLQARADFLPHQPENCPNLTGHYLAHAASGAYEMRVSQARNEQGDTLFRFTANGMDFSLKANGQLRLWDESDGGTGELNLCNGGEFHTYWIRKGKLDTHNTYFLNEKGEVLLHSVDAFGDKVWPWDRIN